MGWIRKEGLGVFKKKKKDDEEEAYVDLDIGEYEEELKEEEIKMYVKTAELTGLYDIPELKKEIYSGNILILDISLAKQDKAMLERAIKDLKMVTLDVGGDIVGIGEDQVIAVPAGVKIERKKVSKR